MIQTGLKEVVGGGGERNFLDSAKHEDAFKRL